MADSVFLHIGPPKTGTTYIQAVLWGNRATLKDQGVLVPGRNAFSQFHAAVDLLDRDPTRLGSEQTAGSWDEIVEEVRAWSGAAVISHENLGFADAAAADRAKLDLDAKKIHIVFTAREFSRIVPAMWQERLKNRSDDSWGDFLEFLQGARDRQPHAFWHQNSGAGLLAWAAGLPPDQVHIVTVPPSGAPPTLLWERFAQAIGIDPAGVDTNVPRSNESLGVVESAFLRRFNAAASGVSWDAYRAHVKHFLAPNVLAAREDSIRLKVRPDEIDPLLDRARELTDTIRKHGFDVVGDLADLELPESLEDEPDRARDPDDVSDSELLDVALDAVEGLIKHAEDLRRSRQEEAAETRQVRRELRETRRRLDELRAINRRLHLGLDAWEGDPNHRGLRRWASRFCRRHRWAGWLRDTILRRDRSETV